MAAAAPAGYLLTGTDGQTIVALSGLPAVSAGSFLSMTAMDVNGRTVSYGIAGNSITANGRNFSGIIPGTSDASLASGFSILLNDASGGSSVILNTGGSQQ